MKKNNFNCDGQLSFFDIDVFGSFENALTPDERLELFRHGDVRNYRTKTIRYGDMLDSEIYAIPTAREASRIKEKKPSREAQEKLNHKNLQKHISRYAHHNFSSNDIWLTVGYGKGQEPADETRAKKDITNYIKRLKRRSAKLGSELRYIYVTEFRQNGEVVRCHHHVIMSGNLDRDVVEKAWKGGKYPQARRLVVNRDTGIKGLAHYLTKGKSYERRWGKSMNLKPPIITVADKKITKRRAEKIALNENLMPGIFEKLYPGFAFYSAEVKRSDYCAGVYIYAQMYKRLEKK